MAAPTATRIESLRTVVGVALVPLAAGAITVPLYVVMSSAGLLSSRGSIDSLDSALALATGVVILAVLVTVFCALPALSWLSGRGALSLRRLLVLGAALGNVPFVLIVLGIVVVQLARGTLSADVAHYWYGAAGAAARVAMGLMVGMGSAAVFWFVAIEGNESWTCVRPHS